MRLILRLDSCCQRHSNITINYLIILIIFLLLYPVAVYANDNIKHIRNIKTWQDMKWKSITRQKFDYSCGAGALSTLIEYYFKDPAPESMILNDIFQRLFGDEIDERKKIGLSMMDLKIQAESMGYIAVGVKLTPEVIVDLPGPVIVLLKGNRVNHFVVLKGVRGGKVYIADPRRGNIRLSMFDFIPQWDNGLTLILGKEGVGLPKDHLLSIYENSKMTEINSGMEIFRNITRSLDTLEDFPQRKGTFVRQDTHQ